MRRALAGLAAGILAATGLALFIPAATAAEEPPPPATIAPPPIFTDGGAPVPVVNPTSGPPGSTISVTVPGCQGFVSAALGTSDGDILVFNASSGDTTQLVIPADTAPGTYFVAAGCDVYTENDVNGVEFTVTPAPVVATPRLSG